MNVPTARGPARILRLVTLPVATAVLSGCLDAQPRWEPVSLTVQTEAQPTELVLDGTGPLGDAERRALDAFRAGYHAAPGDRLVLGYPTARIEAAVHAAQWLDARGIPVTLRHDPLLPVDRLHLGLWRSHVALPECGAWRDGNRSDFDNQPWPNFGCSTARNLGLMVSDPADLATPKPLGAGSGAAAAAAIARQRDVHNPQDGDGAISINLGGMTGGRE